MQSAAIEIRSYNRRIRLQTPLDPENETARAVLLVPVGSTDVQVLAWAEETLPPAAVEELRAIIELEAAET